VNLDADVDYMIVFDTNRLKPDSYLVRLRNYADTYYQRSHTFQNHPTMALNWNNIKFEISPAVKLWGNGSPYHNIPAPHSAILDWVNTRPEELQNELDYANSQPQIRSLLKRV